MEAPKEASSSGAPPDPAPRSTEVKIDIPNPVASAAPEPGVLKDAKKDSPKTDKAEAESVPPSKPASAPAKAADIVPEAKKKGAGLGSTERQVTNANDAKVEGAAEASPAAEKASAKIETREGPATTPAASEAAPPPPPPAPQKASPTEAAKKEEVAKAPEQKENKEAGQEEKKSEEKKDEEKKGQEPAAPERRVLWIENPVDGQAGKKPVVFGEDLGSPLPQEDGQGKKQFWAGSTDKQSTGDATSPVSSPSGRGKSRRRLVGGGYSKNNLLRQSYRHLLLGAALLYAGLCYAAHYVYAPRQVLVEDFLYRMLSFACATVLAAIALDCYFLVLEVRHAEKLASAFCACGLATFSMATHLVIGFQAVPLITNYAGRTVHLVRWVEQITEVLILIFVIEAVNWRMSRSITSICFQVGAQAVCGLGSLMVITGLGLPLQIAGLVLYAQIFYLWFDTLKRFRANMLKPKKERDKNLKQAWGLVNTFFVSNGCFIAINVLGLLKSYGSVQEAMLYSALDVVTKAIYAAILVRR